MTLNTLLSVLVPALFFGAVAASVWYVDARLRRLLGYTSRRRTRAGCAVLLVALLGATEATATSANASLGWVYVAGGYVFTHNERVESHGLQLVGLDYMNADEEAVDLHASADPGTIKATLQKLALAPNIPSVLLHHSPVGVAYAEAAGFDLMLSGHTQGGSVLFQHAAGQP